MQTSRRAVLGRLAAGTTGVLGTASVVTAADCVDATVDVYGEGSYRFDFIPCEGFRWTIRQGGEGEESVSIKGDTYAGTGTGGPDGYERWYLARVSNLTKNTAETDDGVQLLFAY